MKKSIAMILCILLVAISLFSCGSNEEEKSAVSEEPKTEFSVEESVVTESEEESSVDDCLTNPDIYIGDDYDGRTFTVWTSGFNSVGVSEFVYNEDMNEATISEGVNTAIKDRNNKIYDEYGITIAETYFQDTGRHSGASLTKIRNFISTSDQTINMVSVCLYDCGTLTREGNLLDLNSFENLNMENPWWEQYFNQSVTLCGQQYFAIGDIGFNSKSNTPVVFYNPRLIESLGLDDPIECAVNGTWTIDKAITYSKSLCVDSASPEGMDYLDEFGWAGQYDDMAAMIYGAGVRFLTSDSQCNLVFSMKNETTIGVIDKLIEFVNEDCYICANDYWGVSSTPMALLQTAFEEGRSIFYSGEIGKAATFEMKNNDIFGILPVPKYSEEQESYYSLINTWGTNAYGIPASLDDENAEFSAAVMDIMGYYSWSGYPDSISVNYYDKMLKNQKLTREDSEAMLDLIFEARGCELGAILQVGKINGSVSVNNLLVEVMDTRQTGVFVSRYDKYADTFAKDVEAISEFFSVNQ